MKPVAFAIFLLLSPAAWSHSDLSAFEPPAASHGESHRESAPSTLYPAKVVIDSRRTVNVVIRINARLTHPRDIYVGKYVAKGQVLAEMESAELETVQRTYLATVTNLDAVKAFSVTSGTKVMDGKLNLIWRGMTEEDVRHIEETHEPLSRVAIRAPVSGFISSISVANDQIVNGGVQTGQNAAAGSTFASIAEPRGILLEASVPAAEADRLKLGQPAVVLVPGLAHGAAEVRARVVQLYGFVNPATQRRLVRLRLEAVPVGAPVFNGLLATVRFTGLSREAAHGD